MSDACFLRMGKKKLHTIIYLISLWLVKNMGGEIRGSSLVLYLFIIFDRDLKNRPNNIYYIKYFKFCFCENQKIYFRKMI